MSEAKYKDWILETIDSLRKRKARPDLERICHMVERRQNISSSETEADLEKLVASGIVIKVDYKGSTSYRNAAKWRKSHLGGGCLTGSDVIRKLRSVVNGLLRELPRPDAPGEPGAAAATTTGVSYSDIEKRMLDDEDETTTVTPENIQHLLKKEVSHGRLKLLPTGYYVLGAPKVAKTSPSKATTLTSTTTTTTTASGGAASSNGARHSVSGGTTPTKKGRPPGTKRKLKHCVKSLKKVLKDNKEQKAKRPCPPGAIGGSNSAPTVSVSSDDGAVPNMVSSTECDTTPELVKHESYEEATPTAAVKAHDPAAAELTLGKREVLGCSSSSQTTSPMLEPMASPMAVPHPGLACAKCDYCLLTSECNREGNAEYLLYCKDCQAKAHPSCMDYSEDLAKRAQNSPWQCIDCKTCYVCEHADDPDAMLFCDACDKGYHMNCHNPQLLDKPTGKWVCSKCDMELGFYAVNTLNENDRDLHANNTNSSPDNNNTSSINKNTDSGGASCLPTPNDSPIYSPIQSLSHDLKDPRPATSTHEHRPSLTLKISNRHTMPSLPRLSETLPTVVPDASEWTIDDVVQFFRNVGFVDQAEVFREQEIDGRSLLLMRRSDVLTGLSLKLGPALKIYTHVQRLQMRCDSTY